MAKQQTNRQLLRLAAVQRLFKQDARFTRRQRREKKRVGELRVDTARSLDEGVRHVLQFRLAAARQERENRLLRRQSEQRPGDIAAIFQRQHVGQRVADIAHRNTLLLVKSRLERKQGQHAGNRCANLVNTRATPGPDRWADVMDAPNTVPLELSFENQIEIRRVNADKDIRWVGQQPSLEVAANRGDFTIVAKHLGIPADRQFFQRMPGLETHAEHSRPANPEEDGAGKPGLECLHQLAGEQVAGRFSGDHGDPDRHRHGHRMMPRFDTARKSISGLISGWARTS